MSKNELSNPHPNKTEQMNNTPADPGTAGQPNSADNIDYVRPDQTYKERHKMLSRGREKGHSGTTARRAGNGDEMDGYVFVKPRRRRYRRLRRRIAKTALIVLCVILVAVLAVGTTYVVLRHVGQSQLHEDFDDVEIVLPDDSDEISEKDVNIIDSGRTIKYKGETYQINTDIAAIAFLGVDDGSETDLLMADAIYLAAIDPANKNVTVISISRDTMADVNIYSDAGNFVETDKMQLAYAYSYKTPEITGGENTVSSISKLFFGLPLNNYFALNLDALITLNDAMDGVTLTSSMSFVSPIDGRTINAGDTVTLHGKEAEMYIRDRDQERIDANDNRMERQREYIAAFVESLIPAAKKDIGIVTDLYNIVKVNSDTTLTLPKMTYLASEAVGMIGTASDIEFKSLTGTYTDGEFAEFHVDDKQALETMLEVFYNKETE